MKKLLAAGLVPILLALDWAALDDITTGTEPDYFVEYAMLLASGLIIAFVGFAFVRKRLSSNWS